jgi:hypothetical protein
MATHLHARVIVLAWGLAVAAGSVAVAQAQVPGSQLPTDLTNIRHNTGQSVTPYFEGWIRNPDGTFDMVFGYFNRNYGQEFAISAGPNNRIEPGAVDQGQPTYFLPRRQRYVYRVRVPADFGKQEVTWTITANGRTERGYGNLLPEQEITERVVITNGNFDPGHNDPNKPPSVDIPTPSGVRVGVPVTLSARIADDGLPKQRPVTPAAREPAAGAGGFTAQINTSATRPREVTMTWMQYSGPAKVVFGQTDPLPVVSGRAVTTATFTAPGTYRLIGSASDPGRLSTRVTLDLTVTP